MPSKTSAKRIVLVLLALGASVHALCSDLHNPEDPAELMRVISARGLIHTAALMMRTVVFVVNGVRKTPSRVTCFSSGTKARNTTNYKCLVARGLHL